MQSYANKLNSKQSNSLSSLAAAIAKIVVHNRKKKNSKINKVTNATISGLIETDLLGKQEI